MSLRSKTHLIILGMLIQLLFFSGLRAGEIPPGENELKQEVSGPEQHQMTLVSLEPWVVEGELLGLVAAYTYDDVSTERPAAYWELYNNQGSLVAVSWFDKFGARRTAVDRVLSKIRGGSYGVLPGTLVRYRAGRWNDYLRQPEFTEEKTLKKVAKLLYCGAFPT